MLAILVLVAVPDLVEVVHVKLAYEARKVGVPEHAGRIDIVNSFTSCSKVS